MNNEILSCPFCGLEPTLTENFPCEGLFTLSCEKKICAIHPYKVGKTKEECAIDWNRRVSDEPPAEPKPLTLDELRELSNHPVWIADLINGRLSGWDVREESLDNEYYFGFKGLSRHRNEYGDFWLAYNHKPKRGL